MLNKKNNVIAYRYDCNIDELKKGILDSEALLVPPDYEITSNESVLNIINCIENNKNIPFEYLIDRGSLFHLELKVQEFYEKKCGKREA